MKHKWCFPHSPPVGKPRGGCQGGQGRGRGPHKVARPAPGLPQPRDPPAHQRPQPQGQPGPATSLPGTKRGIEGHSSALSSPCPPGRGRLPSAGFPGAVLALQPQHPGELGAPMGAVAAMGHGASKGAGVPMGAGPPKGAGSICCSPGAVPVTWGPHGCAHLSAVPPRGPRGLGKWSQDSY